jgi:hypothetical protein
VAVVAVNVTVSAVPAGTTSSTGLGLFVLVAGASLAAGLQPTTRQPAMKKAWKAQRIIAGTWESICRLALDRTPRRPKL